LDEVILTPSAPFGRSTSPVISDPIILSFTADIGELFIITPLPLFAAIITPSTSEFDEFRTVTPSSALYITAPPDRLDMAQLFKYKP